MAFLRLTRLADSLRARLALPRRHPPKVDSQTRDDHHLDQRFRFRNGNLDLNFIPDSENRILAAYIIGKHYLSKIILSVLNILSVVILILLIGIVIKYPVSPHNVESIFLERLIGFFR